MNTSSGTEDNSEYLKREIVWLKDAYHKILRHGNTLKFVRLEGSKAEGIGWRMLQLSIVCVVGEQIIKYAAPYMGRQSVISEKTVETLLLISPLIFYWGIGLIVVGAILLGLGRLLAPPRNMVTINLDQHLIYDNRLKQKIQFEDITLKVNIEKRVGHVLRGVRVDVYYICIYKLCYDKEAVEIYYSSMETHQKILEETLQAAGIKLERSKKAGPPLF